MMIFRRALLAPPGPLPMFEETKGKKARREAVG